MTVSVQEPSRLHDSNAAVCSYVQQIAIAADQERGSRCDRGGDELVVIRIRADRLLERRGIDHLGSGSRDPEVGASMPVVFT